MLGDCGAEHQLCSDGRTCCELGDTCCPDSNTNTGTGCCDIDNVELLDLPPTNLPKNDSENFHQLEDSQPLVPSDRTTLQT